MIAFIRKNEFKISVLLIVSVLFWTHAPFFLFSPIPWVGTDTLEYYDFTKKIYDLNLPFDNAPFDLPIGYPILLLLFKLLNFNFTQILFIQTVIYLFSWILLSKEMSRCFKDGGLICALSMVVYTISPYTVRHNFAILTESVYTSCLILVLVFLFRYIRTQSLSSYGLLTLTTIVGACIRSNGMILIFIPVLILIYIIYKREKFAMHLAILICIILMNCTVNFYLKGNFYFGDLKRMVLIAKYLQKKEFSSTPNNEMIEDNNDVSRIQIYQNYLSNYYSERPSYYYSIQKTDFAFFITNDMPNDPKLRMFDNKIKLDDYDPQLREFIFQNNKLPNDKSNYHVLDYADKYDNLWIYSTHLAYSILYKMKIYLIVFFLYGLTIFWIIYRQCFTKKTVVYLPYLLGLLFIHLPLLILIPIIFPTYQARYLSVAEFPVCIVVFLFIHTLFTQKRNHDIQRI